MFQSVAPRPGKVAFQIEPFPAPDLQVLPEESKVTELPVAEPVAVAAEIEEPAEEQQIVLESPFLMAAEVEDEVVVFDESSIPEEIVPPAFDEVRPEKEAPELELVQGEVLSEENAQTEFADPTEVVLNSDPISSVAEEPSTEDEKVSEPVEIENYNPFQQFEVSEEISEPMESEREERVTEENVAEVQPSVVTSWQPPAPNGKKKNSKFGGFFRQ